MPVKIPDGLPAAEILAKENIFLMSHERAVTQDIRPLKIAVFNLMPTKLATETQLLRVLSNSPLQVEVTFLHTATYESQNTDKDHLESFYRTFEDVKDEKFDGLIVTGAPVEQMNFEEVRYWAELCDVMDWAEKNVFSTIYICWAAQAALYHFYGVDKKPLSEKVFGVYPHRRLKYDHRLLRGFDDIFYAPHSRHTAIDVADIEKLGDIEILATSDEAGLYLAASKDGSRIFVTGHSEYSADTLELEYKRDVALGRAISPPVNYYVNNDPKREPFVIWRAHGNLLFGNWLNYFVYQETPYDLENVLAEKQAHKKVHSPL